MFIAFISLKTCMNNKHTQVRNGIFQIPLPLWNYGLVGGKRRNQFRCTWYGGWGYEKVYEEQISQRKSFVWALMGRRPYPPRDGVMKDGFFSFFFLFVGRNEPSSGFIRDRKWGGGRDNEHTPLTNEVLYFGVCIGRKKLFKYYHETPGFGCVLRCRVIPSRRIVWLQGHREGIRELFETNINVFGER